MTRFHIITIFPEMFESYMRESIMKRAIEEKIIELNFINPRDFASDKHKKVDDRPYGGGPGMVMMVDPLIKAVADVKKKISRRKKAIVKTILFSPSGEEFTGEVAEKMASRYTDIIMICGRYEGIDYRVKAILRPQQLSIGDYVLTGGELPAMVVVDAVTRFLPGALGKNESVESRRVSSSRTYTRPEIYIHNNKKYKVPKVLLSGNHKEIDKWRAENK